MKEAGINCAAYPDGAAKQFSSMSEDIMDLEVIICGRTQSESDTQNVVIQGGDPAGRHVMIVDGLVQTGGTLYNRKSSEGSGC